MENASLDGSVTSSLVTSERKLKAVADDLVPWIFGLPHCGGGATYSGPTLIPTSVSRGDSVQYRCRCSFQLLRIKDDTGAPAGFQYAIRKDHQPVAIQTFDVANRRIQRAMSCLLEILNSKEGEEVESFGCLRRNLTSVTFSTSWSENDCVLTMNYSPGIDTAEKWKEQARRACQMLNLLQLTGRSRRAQLHALDSSDLWLLADTLLLNRKCGEGKNLLPCWVVKVLGSPTSTSGTSQAGACTGDVLVHYHKPESAFCHPNPSVMCQALAWILRRIDSCSCQRPLRLLELYCGCGAHTIAVAKSGLPFQFIVAVELDERLIQALRYNCQLNDIRLSNDSSTMDGDSAELMIVAQDAGKYVNRLQKQHHADPNRSFDMLLVDPPKQGLDASVCDFARRHTALQDILYVSCGREALVRDLGRLDSRFRVVDCVLLDLFPGTSSVEALVHLRRRD